MAFFPNKQKKNEAKKVKDVASREFYDSSNIREYNAHYSIIMGERSNGKTYDALVHMISDFWNGYLAGETQQSIYLRRWKEDLITSKAKLIFQSLVCNGYGANVISEITDNQYDNVVFKGRAWYLAKTDENDNIITMSKPFAYAMTLSDVEHDKSTSYPYVYDVYFDEFIPIQGNGGHLVNEWVLFTNTVSTVLRHKENFHVYMLANTINKIDMYFVEMGLYNIKNQTQGTIELYKYGDSELTVAVELCARSNITKMKKAADAFFAFDSPKLSMITSGAWAMDIYPHVPYKFNQTDVIGRFYIVFDDVIMESEVVQKDNDCFIFIHEKTTPIKNDDTELIYSPNYDPRPNWRRKITKAFTPAEQKIQKLIQMDKIYFSNNSIGDLFDNYVEWCKKS